MLILKNDHRLILNLYLKKIEEARILSCFAGENSYLTFPCYGLNYFEFEPGWTDFVRQRTLYIENDYVYWYYPRDLDELLHIIQREGITYGCRIVRMAGDSIEVRFKLEVYEHYEYMGSETRALIIAETDEGDYSEHIVPKIEELIKQF